jgi:site-specific DNA recombinase
LSAAGCSSSFPVVSRCGVTEPGQIRDKSESILGLLGGWFSALLSAAALAVITPCQGNGQPRKRSEILAERRARYEATNREIDRLVADAHSRLPRHLAKTIGAIYVRFSTWMQDSAEDQVRNILEFAIRDGIFVPREFVYFDLAVRGYKNSREGLDQLRTVLRSKKAKAVLFFATNRLFRKVYRTLEFVDEVVREHDVRAVFVKSGVDSAHKDRWELALHVRAMMDEFQVKTGADHVRAALEGMFLEGLVRGTLHLGYTGEPIPGKLTKRGRPRQRIVINCDEAAIVLQIFEWYVQSPRHSLIEIARKLNAMPHVPKPRNSNRWTRNTVRALLMRTTYRGLWRFSVTERKYLPTKDYTRQVLRDQPLKEVTIEYLRIAPDALWYAAQQRLSKNRSVRGRKPQCENADWSSRLLSGLFWCPEHDRPLRACSAFGKYLGCPHCSTLDAQERPLFSKPRRQMVLQLLCRRLSELIRQDVNLVAMTVSACQSEAAAIGRPDAGEIARLGKLIGDLTRTIDFNREYPGETAQDLHKTAAIVRRLETERNDAQSQLALIKASADKPIRVPTETEVDDRLRHFDKLLQQAAAGKLSDAHDIARDIIEELTSGRIDMYQEGERREMRGWLQGRFTARILDVLVETFTGVKRREDGEGVDVVIDFKRTRKSDADADKAIRLWLDGVPSKEIAQGFGCVGAYISRLLRIGAKRMGTTLDALRSQRKKPVVDPSRAPRYQTIAEEAKSLWWDDFYPTAEVARQLRCSTVTINAAVRHWHQSRGIPVPRFEDWSGRLEQRVVELFGENVLKIQQIADKMHLGRTRVMDIVREAYRRLGRELPDGRTRHSHLSKTKSSSTPFNT